MRSEALRAQAQGSLDQLQGAAQAQGSLDQLQGAAQASAGSGARVVPGAADPPLDAGIKLSYPSYPFFGSVVTVGEDQEPASSSQYSQPVSSGYPSTYHSQPAAYPSYAPRAAPAPPPVAVSAGAPHYGGGYGR
ncbi:unnamed protein product [Prorocentrum cordatum]|uniref:Uncharacterized protein n=1 Tax=Prorocentrum cordatum TaxID=2364126 RepID=A0ABN9WZ92_9DINO|nr:unnamed protein product [Polarella glacialis]